MWNPTVRPLVMRTLAVAVLVAGCAPDLRVDHPFDGQVASGPLVSTQVLSGEVKIMTVDATNKSSQVFVDLDEGREMKAEEAFASNHWDLAFKRYEISMNGGAGNPTGSVQALALLDQDFDTLTAAPANGYGQDGSTAVLGAWWDYDLLAHRVTTKTNIIYVLISSQGAYFKLMMLDYYDSAGTPAAISLKYAPLPRP